MGERGQQTNQREKYLIGSGMLSSLSSLLCHPAVSSSLRCHPSPCSGPYAPAIHPTSSCSRRWSQMFGAPSRCRCCRHWTLFAPVDDASTRRPPCEQWLAAMVTGEPPLGHYLFRRVWKVVSGCVARVREYWVLTNSLGTFLGSCQTQ